MFQVNAITHSINTKKSIQRFTAQLDDLGLCSLGSLRGLGLNNLGDLGRLGLPDLSLDSLGSLRSLGSLGLGSNLLRLGICCRNGLLGLAYLLHCLDGGGGGIAGKTEGALAASACLHPRRASVQD